MSKPSQYIDLTIESDDESYNHGQINIRAQQSSTKSFFHVDPILQNAGDGLVASMSSRIFPDNHHRQQPPLQHHNIIQKRPQTQTIPRRNFALTQDYMNSREGGRTISNPILPIGSMRREPQKRACINCTEVNVTCDGEQPCSACVEPGLTCYYPGEKPITKEVSKSSLRTENQKTIQSSVTYNIVEMSQVKDDGFPRFETTLAASHVLTQQSDLLPNCLLNIGRQSHNYEEVGVQSDEEAFDDSEESDDNEILSTIPELEDVKRLLKKHETRMKEHQAYLLQPLLNQSKLDAAKALRPDRPAKQQNPFNCLVDKAKTFTTGSSSKSSHLQLQMKSNKPGSLKKWTQMSVSLKVLNTDPTILPKYKSIGRLGISLLAPNIRTLKYWPYFPDEENLDPSEAKKNEELEERYQHDDNHLLAQRKCSELVDMWQPWVKDFVSKLRIEFGDILYWFLNTADNKLCDTCERDILAESFTDIYRLVSEPSERSLKVAQLSAIALRDVAKISMWHFVLGASSVKDLLKQAESPKKSAATLCSICFLHNCLSHGAFQEPEELGGAVIMGGNIEIDDEESNHNIRVSVAVPNRPHDGIHQCGLYCVAAEARVKDILGRRKDGTVGGIHNHTVHVPRLSFSNDDFCGEHCYWSVEKRTKFGTIVQVKDFQPSISTESKHLFQQFLRLYCDNQRAPCMIAKDVEGLKCIDAFYYILAEHQRNSHYRQAVANAALQGTRKISKLTAGLDMTLSADLDERPPFVPCSHAGVCLNNPDCSCAQNKVHCEWFCGCDKSCDRRFPGCKCVSTNKTCFNDKSCECWKHNRECDPWLCGSCGVVEVLDPQNKYKEEIRKGRCRNNRIQLELPARTIKAPSEVQGWGLYAGIDLEENTFIGEYKGETVGNQESDRRGAVYANIGQEYLFVMNRDQQIDGSNFGNKTRFINNSQRDDYINVFAKKLLCNGVQRVMLYAKKPIMAGEELLYNYNYPISVTKKFWERGEGPTNVHGAVVAKPSVTWTQPRVNGRFAKVAGKQDGEQSAAARTAANGGSKLEEGEESMSKRDSKRKRMSEGDFTRVFAGRPTAAKGVGLTEATENVVVAFTDDPDDSDFELVDATESESVDEVEADSEAEETSTAIGRRRVVHLNDRRRGGLAQSKAWETRRKRNGNGK